MPKLPIFIVDAFVAQFDFWFRGNPAAVVLLTPEEDAAQNDDWRLEVASEMNLSETAFVVATPYDKFNLRWFTPTTEVKLCGHATLASAHVLWEQGILPVAATAKFQTRSGLLSATRTNGWIELDFPAQPVYEAILPSGILESLNLHSDDRPLATLRADDDWLIHVQPEQVRNATPDMAQLKRISQEMGVRGVILTARGSGEAGPDFISRFFGPGVGVDEDPVTGSAHTKLAPYWGNLLGKDELVGYQASNRGGLVRCRLQGERVLLGGQAETTLQGTLLI